MNTPKVSIIVPIYNSEKFLDRCISSLVNQTLKDIEIILISDASPDNSKEIMERYANQDERVVTIYNEVNGSPNPRNAGIQVAKADYLGFVDADDWVELDMYEKLYRATHNESVDVVISKLQEISEDGELLRVEDCFDNLTAEIVSKKDVVNCLLKHGGRLFTNLWRRDIIIDNDLFFLENNNFCDSVVNLWYLSANSFVKVNEVLYNYYVNTLSISRVKNNKRMYDRLSSAEDMFSRAKALDLYNEFKEEIDYRFYVLFFYNSIIVFCRDFTRPQFQKIDEVKKKFKLLLPNSIRGNKYYVLYHTHGIYQLVYDRFVLWLLAKNTIIGSCAVKLFWWLVDSFFLMRSLRRIKNIISNRK